MSFCHLDTLCATNGVYVDVHSQEPNIYIYLGRPKSNQSIISHAKEGRNASGDTLNPVTTTSELASVKFLYQNRENFLFHFRIQYSLIAFCDKCALAETL